MADREWYIDGVQILETGTEEYFVHGVQVNEDQAAAPPGGTTPKGVFGLPLHGPLKGPIE